MWLKLIALLTIIGGYEALAGPKNFSGEIHRQVLHVREIFPDPTTTGIHEEETMVARDLKITLRSVE